jgi:hypothetical protein
VAEWFIVFWFASVCASRWAEKLSGSLAALGGTSLSMITLGALKVVKKQKQKSKK